MTVAAVIVRHGGRYVRAAALSPYPDFWADGVRPGAAGHFTYELDPNTLRYTLLHPPGREAGVTKALRLHEEGHIVFDLVHMTDVDTPTYTKASARWLLAQWENYYAQHVTDEAGHLSEVLVPYVERNQTYRYDAEEAFADLYSCLARRRTTDAAATQLVSLFQGLAIERHNRALAQYTRGAKEKTAMSPTPKIIKYHGQLYKLQTSAG